MASRNPTRQSPARPYDTAAAPPSGAELLHQQMATTASVAAATLRAMELLQQVQGDMLQRAALLHAETARRLRAAGSPTELMAAQTDAMLQFVAQLAQYGQEVMEAALGAQAEIVPAVQEAQPEPPAAGPVPHPMFEAWQAMFSAPMNGAAMWGARH